MASETDEKLGKRIQRFGRYEILAHIATGGMGAVYKARDTGDNQIVALKVMSPKLAAKPNMVRRFQTEARSASKLGRHENIVAIHEFGQEPETGMYFLALEFIDGKDLHDYVARAPAGRLSAEEAQFITLQATRALDHAHQHGIIHRDIKPSNFLVTSNGGQPVVKLTDLGLSRHDEDPEDHRVTKAGMTLGTIDYIAPEQARDSSRADIRSDLYALGCTLYHMLAGHPPFPKGTMAEKLVQHLSSEAPDIRKLNKDVPVRLTQILDRLLAKKPRDRYQTPAELLEDLEDPQRVLRPREAAPEEKKPRRAPESTVAAAPAPTKPASESVARKRPKKKKESSWLPVALGGGVLALVAVVVLIIVNSRRTPPSKPPDENKVPEKKIESVVEVKPVQQFVGPPVPELKPLYRPVLTLDPVALTKDHYGPFAALPEPPAGAKVIVVSRLPLPGTTSVRTLAEAWEQAAAADDAVIEIRDQGPHFLAVLPALSRRNLWIRGAADVRPLLAWDGAGGNDLVTLIKGNLTLADLDVVAKLGDRKAPACLFHVQGGDFQARDCTFSIAGKNSQGVLVARLQGMGVATTAALAAFQDAGSAQAKARFSRCFARGHDLVLLATHRTPADILIDGTLAVGAAQPLIQHRNQEEEGLMVRIVRSTLAVQENLWRWQNTAGKGGSPRLKGLAWDSVLARTDVAAPEGDMLLLADGARTNLMGFKAVNCLYAGWRHLLASGDRTASTTEEWRSLWGYGEGDLALAEAWPSRPPGDLEDVPAPNLAVHETAAAFRASFGSAPIGCELHHLPPEPPVWHQRTFARYVTTAVPVPEWEVPEPTGPEGMYHGEIIDVSKVDLGQYVQTRLQTQKPGPRIVLRITGKGTSVTSPLRFRGVAHVVLHFEQPPPGVKAEPIVLEMKGGGSGAALIDVEGGNLDIHQGRFRFENSRIAALPPHMIRVRGGDLRLLRCALVGPLSKSPETFQSLIAVEGSGLSGLATHDVTLRDCVLHCGKPILELKNPGLRLRCQGCLLYALGDAVAVDLGVLTTSRPGIATLFENNTVAHRQGFVQVRCFEGPPMCQPVIVQAHANYFLDPFSEEPRQSSLVRISAENLARGLLLWQGKGNVFARDRLQAYYASADDTAPKQPFKEWEKLGGPIGETDALHVDAGAGKFNADLPTYDRLALPSSLRLDPRPGADLAKLGLAKKK